MQLGSTWQTPIVEGVVSFNMANKYDYNQRNETRPTSSRGVYFAESASVSHNRGNLGKQLSGFDNLWIGEILLAN